MNEIKLNIERRLLVLLKIKFADTIEKKPKMKQVRE
jgi:hypothetical protein